MLKANIPIFVLNQVAVNRACNRDMCLEGAKGCQYYSGEYFGFVFARVGSEKENVLEDFCVDVGHELGVGLGAEHMVEKDLTSGFTACQLDVNVVGYDFGGHVRSK